MLRARADRINEKGRPLVQAYWWMPLAAGLAVILTATGMLIETLLLANRIDTNVTPIKSATASIEVHAQGIAVLNQVDATAKQIKTAADPLTGQASSILSTVGDIQATVAKIDAATGSILSRAGGIDQTVTSITPHVLQIAVPVESIEARLGTTVGDLNTVITLVTGVRADTDALVAPGILPAIDDHAASIACKTGAC